VRIEKDLRMTEANQLQRGLSLFDSATIVAGSMIGSGIFIVSADIVRQTGSPAGLLAVWILSGLMTVAGALAYGELAAMMPDAGGQYVFLREAYGGVTAFSFGWTLLLVIQTGTIAAVAVAFARFAGVIFPMLGSRVWFGVGSVGFSGERLGAIAVIVTLTAVNLRGLDTGRVVQNVLPRRAERNRHPRELRQRGIISRCPAIFARLGGRLRRRDGRRTFFCRRLGRHHFRRRRGPQPRAQLAARARRRHCVGHRTLSDDQHRLPLRASRRQHGRAGAHRERRRY
jgi:hypothetical protein